MRPAGVGALLDVRIRHKAHVAASGQRFSVLDGIAFSLQPGAVAAFVGPSGCGKTTMLRIIAGLDMDFEGDVQRPPGRLAMVFQEPRLLPWRTVDDNVRVVAPEVEEAKLAALFDVLGLAGHRAHYPGELSLGLARRVALARAFAVEPGLLLLDEPFASLDEALANRLRDELAMLVDRQPVTTLLVTHDVDEAIRLADRLVLLTPRPATILAELPVPRPRQPRQPEEFAALRAEVRRRRDAAG